MIISKISWQRLCCAHIYTRKTIGLSLLIFDTFICQQFHQLLNFWWKVIVSGVAWIEKTVKIQVVDTWFRKKDVSINRITKRFGIHQSSVKSSINKFVERYSFDEMLRRRMKPGSADPKLYWKVVNLMLRNSSMLIRDLAKKASFEVEDSKTKCWAII